MSRHDDGFAEFAAARARPMLQTAWLLTGDRYLAQDLVQDALARMFQVWGRRGSIDSPEAYAQTVLVRTYLSMRRRRMFFERPAPDIPDLAERKDDPDLRLTLESALTLLSPGDRAVLVLRYLCDRSVEQVAVDLNRSPAAIRNLSKRALARLRTALGDDYLAELSAHR